MKATIIHRKVGRFTGRTVVDTSACWRLRSRPGTNLTERDEDVTCKFCLREMAKIKALPREIKPNG